MLAKALASSHVGKVEAAKAIVESGERKAILRLIDAHTSSSRDSAFLSATFNPKLAQVFAHRRGETIYKISLDPNRVILDATNLGRSDEAGEVLILGGVLPSEIVAVKIRNDEWQSELLFQDDSGVSLISNRYEDHPHRLDRSVKDPLNWAPQQK